MSESSTSTNKKTTTKPPPPKGPAPSKQIEELQKKHQDELDQVKKEHEAQIGQYNDSASGTTCRDLRRTKKCRKMNYVPYPEAGLENFRQSIMNAIARKNVADKTKNAMFGRTFTRSQADKITADKKREADIRGVLKNIAYSTRVLKDYTLSSFGDAIGAQARSAGHGVAEFGRNVSGRQSRDGTLSGSQTKTMGGKSRRRKKNNSKSKKYSRKTQKYR
jgi:hypothetical protein